MDSLILQAVGDNVVCVDIAAVVSKFALMHEVDLEVLELQQSSQFLSQPSFISSCILSLSQAFVLCK